MWQQIRNWFTGVLTPDKTEREKPAIEDTHLVDLQVVPREREDFDAESCIQLLNTLAEQGAETVGDVLRLGIRVTLEQFFTGNRCKHSIAANVCPDPPFDTAQSWFNHLKSVRDHERVQDVLVQVYMVEPYEDGHVSMWPYADTIWVYSDLAQSTIESLLAPIDPDKVCDASKNDPKSDLRPPADVPAGSTPYWVWWD